LQIALSNYATDSKATKRVTGDASRFATGLTASDLLWDAKETRRCCRAARMNATCAWLFLACAGVGDFHGFHVLPATVLVPLQSVMVLVGHLDDFADLLLHNGNAFVFADVREGLRRGIVSAFREHDARAHVIDP